MEIARLYIYIYIYSVSRTARSSPVDHDHDDDNDDDNDDRDDDVIAIRSTTLARPMRVQNSGMNGRTNTRDSR